MKCKVGRFAAIAALLFVCGILSGCSSGNDEAKIPESQLYDPASLPKGELGKSIAYGHDLIVDTQKYMKGNIRSQMSCEACHTNGGTKAHGGSFVGTYAQFPQWNMRAHRVITLQDRLTECFLYSMNGHPPAYSSREMIAMVAYIAWLSRGTPTFSKPSADQHSTLQIPKGAPDLKHGAEIYSVRCVACHQANGAGLNASAPGTYAAVPGKFPPLWGPNSFNNKAGMAHLVRMVPFVYYNMPQNAPGSLSPKDAYDVSAFVLSHSRPVFNGSALVSTPALPAKYY